MTNPGSDLEARLRRDLAELGGLPSSPPRERTAVSGRRPAVTVSVALVVVLALVAASFAAVKTAEHHNSSVRPGRAPASNPIVTTSAPVSTDTPTKTATQPTATAPVGAATTQPAFALQSVRWASVVYPMQPNCNVPGLPPITVQQVDYPVPVAGEQLAVVMVRCSSGAGTPPSALYVFDHATSATSAHLSATLVADSDDWQASGFSADGATIRMAADGFSSTSRPNCCPDVHATLIWMWSGAGYKLANSRIPPHVTGPPTGYY